MDCSQPASLWHARLPGTCHDLPRPTPITQGRHSCTPLPLQDFKMLIMDLPNDKVRFHFQEVQRCAARGKAALVQRWVARALQPGAAQQP